MKKILSVLMSFCTLFFMPIGKINAMQNQVVKADTMQKKSDDNPINILVVCQDEDILNEFCNYLKNKEFISTGKKIIETTKGCPAVRYSSGTEQDVNLIPIHFDVQHIGHMRERINTLDLENICQVILLYDISDKSLDYIIENQAKIQSNEWRDLLDTYTFLNFCINLSLERSMNYEWFGSFNFFSYDKSGLLSEEERENRREALNTYTVNLEYKLNLPNSNTWGRGHANYLNCQKAFFSSFFGNLERFDLFLDRKKNRSHQYILPTVRIAGIGTFKCTIL